MIDPVRDRADFLEQILDVVLAMVSIAIVQTASIIEVSAVSNAMIVVIRRAINFMITIPATIFTRTIPIGLDSD